MSRIAALCLGALFGLSAVAHAAEEHPASSPSPGPSPATSIVAAENFYADLARQIAGPNVRVTGILSNPDQDPHLFEASPSVAREVASATITISNGVDYDPWMQKLLAANPRSGRADIVAALLVGAETGSNPHLWYDPHTMRVLAAAFTAALDTAQPAETLRHHMARDRFLTSLGVVDARIANIRHHFGGTMVAATEPVFGLMSNALGFVTRDVRFQLAVMNNTEPRISDVAAFENDLRRHRVALLIYNSQASDSAAERLLGIARQAEIPVVGVTETEPRGQDYQHWMLSELDAVDRALVASSKQPANR